jgi:CheY-like chemotaxis protein
MADVQRILIVEDDALIGMMLSDMFEALDLAQPALASSMVEAIEMIEGEQFVGALIDVHLGGEKGWPVAELLANRGVPFAFTTGGGTDIPNRFDGHSVVMKPFRLNDIERVVQTFL